jgi:RNA polymerase sigma factor (sigma-70 family)
MTPDSVTALVAQARDGDRPAFGRLVQRFQDFAVACAYARLGDREAARDAAQEALVDAFLHLPELREPAAFPGWLRRIVFKHCDRLVRGKRPAIASLDRVAELGDDAPSASEALASGEDGMRLRAALEALPEQERMLLALQYLGGQGQREIASHLELPLSTVKKRLHTARRRLRERWMTMVHEELETLRPSQDDGFSSTIELFLAVRAGDVNSVRAVLDRRPELVDAEETWERDGALHRELPVPSRATPLIRAAERGDLALVELLLERGAEVDRDCGCQGGESALWAATVAHRTPVVERLLAAGADPDATAFSGHTPLHVAAIRGFDDIARLLLSHGADPDRSSHDGRTAAEWARSKGHAAIVERLEPGSTGVRPARALDAPLTECFATGIKALDLFAPLRPGFAVRVHGGAGVGQSVLLAELSQRAHTQGWAVVWAAWARRDWEEGEVEELLAETGTATFVRLLRSGAGDSEAQRRALAEHALRAAEEERATGRPVLLVLMRAEGYEADVEALRPGRRGEGAPITTLDLAPWRTASRREVPQLSAPFDAQIVLDPLLARCRHFPAIDPVTSTSRALGPEGIGAHRAEVSVRARQLLARYRELDANACVEDLPPEQRALAERARRLQAYLTQPFFTAESFHGRPGSFVTPERLVEDVEALLAGSSEELDARHYLYRGTLDDVRAAAEREGADPAYPYGARVPG